MPISVAHYSEGSVSEIVRTIVVSEEEMRKGAIVLDQGRTYILSATLEVKGNGALRVGNFHHDGHVFNLESLYWVGDSP
ncbi:MAG: hypothetical protein ACLSFK_08910 [Streptococcus salivarius]